MIFLLLIPLIILTIFLLVLVGIVKVYEKAGKPWWSAIIPIYNLWVLVEIVDVPRWWFIGFLLPLLGSAPMGSTVGSICNLIGGVTLIVVLYKLSQAFGHGALFTLGLVLLGPIFLMILGFGKSQYQLGTPSSVVPSMPTPPMTMPPVVPQ